MCARFTDDEVGKTVVNANGEEVGMVTAVEHGTARVEPEPGITDTIKAALGWEGTSEESYPLQEAAVDRITDEEIRLSGEHLHTEGDTAEGHTDTPGEPAGGAMIGSDHPEGTDRSEQGAPMEEGVTDTDERTQGETGVIDTDEEGLMDRDDDELIGSDDDDELIGSDDDDELIGSDDDDELIGSDDDDELIGSDDSDT